MVTSARANLRITLLVLALAGLLAACGGKVDHNETEDSNLGHWGRALASVLTGRYEELSTGWFGGVEKNGRDRCSEILREDFGVEDREGLLREIRFALRSGAREDYHYDADALLLLAELPEEERETAMSALSAQDRRRYELVAYNVEQWGELGLLGWDMAKVCLLAQLGYTAGYLTHAEAQAVVEPAAAVIKSYFSDWQELCRNVLDGEALILLLEPSSEEGGYAARALWLETLIEAQDSKDMLFDEALFEQELDPLEELSYTALLV